MVKHSRKKIRFCRPRQMRRLPNLRIRLLLYQRESLQPNQITHTCCAPKPVVNMAVACRLCEEPACVAACPRDALTQSEETGAIIIDKDKCNGCGWCIEACDYGAMMLHPETKAVYICDLCKDKPEGPQCVKWCPEEALTVVTSDVLAQKARISAIKKLFQEKE